MRKIRFEKMLYVAMVCLFTVSLTATAFGQGRGGGRGGGVGGGQGSGGGPPSGVGVDRGIGNASGRSNGRSDEGLGNASDRSNGRSDAGLDRARLAADNRRQADKDLREHPGIANTLHVNANDLRSGYQAALLVNPNLKFGQYVAATRLEQNLHSRVQMKGELARHGGGPILFCLPRPLATTRAQFAMIFQSEITSCGAHCSFSVDPSEPNSI